MPITQVNQAISGFVNCSITLDFGHGIGDLWANFKVSYCIIKLGEWYKMMHRGAQLMGAAFDYAQDRPRPGRLRKLRTR